MPLPTDQALYETAKIFIKSKYKKNSPLASGAIVKHYKQLYKKKYGDDSGSYSQDEKPKNLKRYFEEKWVDINPMLGVDSVGYPVFRPTVRVNNKTPILFQDTNKKELKEKIKLKQKYRGNKNLSNFKTVVHNGGKLETSTFKNLLSATYSKNKDVDGFIKDKKISTKTSKVFVNPDSGQAVVAHRGTSGFTDWFNNVAYAYGGERLYKLTPRYKEAEKVQKEAEKKYGSKNITTIGHSQGGLQSELLGGDSNEIITLNKATRPFSNKKNLNQYDVSSSWDIVSSLNPFQPKNDKEIIIPSQTSNPLTEHSTLVLDRLDKEFVGGMVVRRFS